MKPSRNVIEQRSRDYVVTLRHPEHGPVVRVWSTHEMAVKFARLALESGATDVAIDGKAVGDP